MSAWIAALRIARREALRARRRSALVLAMIVLPVAVLSFAAVITDMFQLTPEEQLTRQLGRADASVTWISEYPIEQFADGTSWHADRPIRVAPATAAQILAMLPPGSQLSQLGFTDPSILTTEFLGMSGRVIDLADPVTEGIGSIVDGKAPEGPDQIALTDDAAELLGLSIGDEVRTPDPDRFLLVTGIAELHENLGPWVILPPGAVDQVVGRHSQIADWLVTMPVSFTWDDVQRLNDSGILVISRDVMTTPTFAPPVDIGETLAIGVLLFGLVVLEVVLLAGPAFAVGARRRARDLALVAAAGAEPKHLRRIVLADGIVLGVAGATIGIALGVFGAVLGRPFAEEFIFDARAGGWRFMPWALFAIAVLAVGTGAAAAAVPAFTAARQDVVAVLSGRRPVIRSKRRWIVAGVTMTVAGTFFALTGAIDASESLILFGIVVGELGLVLLTPALIGLVARVGRWLPLAPRLALRDTARNRSSAAPAVSAIMAAVAGAVSVGVFVAGSERQASAFYQPSIPVGHAMVEPFAPDDSPLPEQWEITAAVTETFPVTGLHAYRVPTCGGFYCEIAVFAPSDPDGRYAGKWIVASIVDDGETLATLADVSISDLEVARRVLADGGVIVPDPIFLDRNGLVTIGVVSKELSELPATTLKVPGVVLTGVPSRLQAMVSTSAANRLGVSSRLAGLIVATERTPTLEEEKQLNERLADFDAQFMVYVERGYPPYTDPVALILAFAAAMVALGAAAIATGLATADRRADMGTLAAVGADPRLRRRLSQSQAGVISILGAGLGLLAGLAGSGAMIFALNRVNAARTEWTDPIPFVMPWPTLAIIIAVPLVAMAGAGLLTRSWLPIERRF